MRAEVRQMLDQIDAFLTEQPAEIARDLVDILTALRGPDDGARLRKQQTTAHIRRAALPRVCDRTDYSPLITGWDTRRSDVADRCGMDDLRYFDHFYTHARRAFEAIDRA